MSDDPKFRARQMYAEICDKPASAWEFVAAVEPDHWYDWACPETGKFGQCMMRPDWSWHQAPLGTAPVILRYVGR